MKTKPIFRKALLPALLLAAMLLLLIPLLCLPASAETVGYYTYTVSNGEATITNVDTAISGDVVIPDTLGGYPVTSIGWGAFEKCSSLTRIEIPSGVTSIGDSAFEFCSSLTSIEIPSSVTSIGLYAFAHCSKLASIAIPSSVTSIGEEAFYGCSSLTSIEIPSSVTSISYAEFGSCPALESITVDPANTTYHSADNCLIETASKTLIAGCKNSIIPADGSVTRIGGGAFLSCSNLTSITIPFSVTSIGFDAFYNCSSLMNIEIPSSVTSIGSNAFDRCSQLTDVYYDGTKEQWDAITIGDYNEPLLNANIVFEEEAEVVTGTCGDNLTWSLDLGTGILTISGTGAMGDWYDETDVPWYGYRSSIKTVDISAGVTYIGFYAFYGCDALTSVNCEENAKLTVIGEYAFCDCTSLTSVSLPDGLLSINMSAFQGCTTLACLEIPTTVEFVGDGAFYGCSNLIQVESGLSYVDNWVIDCDRSFTTASVREGIVGIAHMAFPSSIVSVTLPSSVERINAMAFDACFSLATVYYGGTEEEWNAIDIDECNDPLLNANIIFAREAPSLIANVLLGDKFSANAKVTVPEDVTATEAGLYVDGVKMTGTLSGGYYLVEGFFKTAAKETGKTVTVQAYYVADGVEVMGNEITTSIAALLRTYLESDDAEVVALATATLNYAAAAQIYFGYDVENLVNEGLSATLPSEQYQDNFAVTVAKPDATVAPKEIALLLNDTVDLHVWIAARNGATVDFAELSLAISENADMSGATTVAFNENGFATVKAISPTNWNDTYYFCIVDGEGNAVSATFTYGVSTYFARMAENEDANLRALVASMMALYEANEDYLTPDIEEPYVPEEDETAQDNISGIF